MRQQSYKVTLLVMAALTLLFFPSPDSEYQTLIINGYRGIYNSAWIGLCLAMLNTLLLPLICFYLVKNAIELDRKSKTCELIAATPLSKHNYLLSKWITNIVILTSFAVIMVLSSLLVQLYYGETQDVQIWLLIWPQLIFVWPMLVVVASVALMFESIKWLRGSFGNIAYCLFWFSSIAYTLESVTGVGAMMKALDTEVETRFPSQSGTTNLGVAAKDDSNPIKTFVWEGVKPQFHDFMGMLPLFGISFLALMVAYLCFDRFRLNAGLKKTQQAGFIAQLVFKLHQTLDEGLHYLTKYTSFTQLVYLEFKLLLKGRSIYWFLGLLGLNVAQLVVEVSLLTSVILPVAWLWCSLVISQLGQFEKQAGTLELIAYSRQSSMIQSFASYFSAWFLLLGASMGSLIRLVIIDEWMLNFQLFIAISFMVAFALFCGSMFGTKRMFEALFPVLWYMGPLQGALYLDFFGAHNHSSWESGIPLVYAFISIALMLSTLLIKKRQGIS